MARSLVFIAIALIAVVSAGPGDKDQPKPDHKKGPGGFHHFFPKFFGNVSEEGKKEIGALFKNQDLTLAEVDTKIAALAEKYGVAAAYKEHKAKEATNEAEAKKKTASVISNLSAVSAKLTAIHDNKSLTRKAQREAIAALRKEHEAEVAALDFIGKRSHGFGKHHGRHGKGNGKFFGKRGGNKMERKTAAQ